jgi:hypothetical protein
MTRTVSWFSCGAASAVATKLSKPDVIAYCDTGSEDYDNKRFMADCQVWFKKRITVLKNKKYKDTWALWEAVRYLAGVKGAPCTGALKVEPRIAFQLPDDVHIFGYTADSDDVRRANTLREIWPDLTIETPLIDRGITKAACLSIIQTLGIKEPRTYEMGFPNANCIPCVKATSPSYWALVRLHFPEEFDRMAKISRTLDVKLTRLKGERAFIDDIPLDHPVTEPIAPECDFLCAMAEQELMQ